MPEMRTFKVMINNRGSIIRTTVSVESPAGHSAAQELAERMYGGPGIRVSILA
jgi:hypothetical protein